MITLDVETKSYADLPKVGTWCYSEHPTTEVICVCYGIDDQPIQTWWPGKKLEGVQAWQIPSAGAKYSQMPSDLYMAMLLGKPVEAHNVAFERGIWENILTSRYGWLLPFDHAWRDTMAVACYYAMPAALDRLCKALGYEGKDPEGGRLISKYSKLYLKTAKEDIPEEDFIKFVDYCKWDVVLEQTISDHLGDLSDAELEAFLLDQEMNMRGIYLDEVSINNATAIIEQRGQELAIAFEEITSLKPTQAQKIKAWFAEQSSPVENLQAEYLQRVLDGEEPVKLHGTAREAAELRLRHAKASTKKLASMLRNRSWDGRARFQSRYHGAATGRPTGTGFQPLNLSKGFEDVPPEQLITDLSHRDPKWLDIMYGDAMEAVGKASRHHIRAEKGKRIIAGDYVSIEAVLLSCLAGEEWKIEAFRNRDPIYELMGCKIHNLGEDAVALAKSNKKKFKEVYPGERFDGKTGELAFGYQGALGAWRKFDKTTTHTDERVVEICKQWREEHPAIKELWANMEEAAIDATHYPGRACNAGPFTFEVIDEWLAMWLPDGKRIWYFKPELHMGMPHWHKPLAFDPKDESTWQYEDCSDGTCSCRPRLKLTYMAQKEGQWRRTGTYGGKLTENATQATSRQVLVPALARLQEAGYETILTVYDEIICEMPEGQGSAKELVQIMAESPGSWATTNGKPWPISVDAWEGERYKK